jgi:hypothetical protein
MAKIERNAAITVFIFINSNLFAKGNRIKDKSNATLNGISIDLANTRNAKSAKTVAILKNIF